ncbi:hypothetical protein OA84_08155 [Kaistella solincola]|uniref:Uncharacterized protein n=1 Tax=Kaistella solincola TaxID=510955 RepID=A0ABR4ZQ55_9FLAO|nr:hypothetical protein [Kaistella solincola]KIA83476.1 hypothetical protein OA84_08155 [Kaistella solincola]
MKNFIAASAIILFALACEKKADETVVTNQSNQDSMVIPESNEAVESSTLQTCYMEAIGKDTVFLSLEDNLGTFIGKMRYKNFEKDSSHGDIMGSQNGDTLKIVYTFQAEGTTSEREIYFLKKDGSLLEATGLYDVDGIKSVYAKPNELKYDGHVLKQTDCTDFDKNFVLK